MHNLTTPAMELEALTPNALGDVSGGCRSRRCCCPSSSIIQAPMIFQFPQQAQPSYAEPAYYGQPAGPAVSTSVSIGR